MEKVKVEITAKVSIEVDRNLYPEEWTLEQIQEAENKNSYDVLHECLCNRELDTTVKVSEI